MQRQKVQHHGKQGQTKEEEQEEEEKEEEHIDCVCGVTGDTPGAQLYEGLWLQCDECLSWLHGACVGFPKRVPKGQNKEKERTTPYSVNLLRSQVLYRAAQDTRRSL